MPTLQYRIQVKNLMLGGHPHQELFTDLGVATKRYNELRKEYEYNDIEFSETVTNIISYSMAKDKPMPNKCPRGHSGLRNEKNVLIKNGVGGYYCSVCGEFF